MFYRIFVLTSIILLYVTACSSNKNDGQRCITGSSDCLGDIGSGVEPVTFAGFLCNANPQPSIVNANEILALKIDASNGTAPYSIPAAGIPSFVGSTTIYGSYFNDTGSDRVVTRTVTVVDSLGAVANCSFSVTVKSLSNSGLACNIESTPTNPKMGQTVTLTTTASGGDGNYVFSDYTPQSSLPSWTVTPVMDNGAAKAAIIYNTAGLRTAYIKVSSAGKVATCSEQINVAVVGMTVDATPNRSVPSGQTITLKANLNGFSTTSVKTFTFTPDNADIEAVPDTADPSQAVIKVKVADLVATFRAFNVKVSVTTSENETVAPITVALVIGSEVVSDCRLDVGTGSYQVGQRIAFRLVCPGASIQTFDPGYGAQQWGSVCDRSGAGLCPMFEEDSSITRIYSYVSPGVRYVTAKIGPSTYVRNIVDIRKSIVGCTVSTNPMPSLANSVTTIQTRFVGQVPVGSYNVNVVAPSATIIAIATHPTDNNDVLNKRVIYSAPGTYSITAEITDNMTQSKVSCSTNHVVYPAAPGLLANVYRLPGYMRNSHFSLKTVDWSCLNYLSNFIGLDINVPARHYKNGFPGVPLNGSDNQWFAIRYKGFISIPVAGSYGFQVKSDDGSLLKVDGITIIDRDGLHSPGSSGVIYHNFSTPGSKSFEVDYYQGPKNDIQLQVLWAPPGTNIHVIEPGAFSH